MAQRRTAKQEAKPPGQLGSEAAATALAELVRVLGRAAARELLATQGPIPASVPCVRSSLTNSRKIQQDCDGGEGR